MRSAGNMVQGQAPLEAASPLGLFVRAAIVSPTEAASGILAPAAVTGLIHRNYGAGIGNGTGAAVGVVGVSANLSSWVTGTQLLAELSDYSSAMLSIGCEPLRLTIANLIFVVLRCHLFQKYCARVV